MCKSLVFVDLESNQMCVGHIRYKRTLSSSFLFPCGFFKINKKKKKKDDIFFVLAS